MMGGAKKKKKREVELERQKLAARLAFEEAGLQCIENAVESSRAVPTTTPPGSLAKKATPKPSRKPGGSSGRPSGGKANRRASIRDSMNSIQEAASGALPRSLGLPGSALGDTPEVTLPSSQPVPNTGLAPMGSVLAPVARQIGTESMGSPMEPAKKKGILSKIGVDRITDAIQDKLASGMYKLISKVLKKALGQFIDGIDEDTLNLKDGLVQISNLSLRPEAFHSLNLPLQLKGSHVGRISIDLPLANLKTQPIVVELRDIYATLSPSADVDMSVVKRSQLDSHSKQWSAAALEIDEEVDAQGEKEELGFAGKYVQKIMENIQFVLENVHIRFEDDVTSQRASWDYSTGPASFFAAGVTLDRVEIQSYFVDMASRKWQHRFQEETSRYVNKIFRVGQVSADSAAARSRGDGEKAELQQSGLGVYWNCGEKPYDDPGSALWQQRMQYAIARDGKPAPNTAYVYGPQSLEIQFSMDSDANESVVENLSRIWFGNEGSKIEAAIQILAIRLQFRQLQLHQTLHLLSWIGNIERWCEFGERPACPVRKGANAVKWWNFAIKCVLTEVRERRKATTVQSMRESLQMALEYVQLFERKDKGKRKGNWANLTKPEIERITEIEDSSKFNVATLTKLRTVAWARLHFADKQEQQHIMPAGKNMLSRGSSKPQVTMTKAQLAMIEPRWVIQKRVVATSASYAMTSMHTHAKIQIGEVHLHLEIDGESPLLQFEVDAINTAFHARNNGEISLQLGLGALVLHDRHSSEPLIPQLIQMVEGEEPLLRFNVTKAILVGAKVSTQSVQFELQTHPLQIVLNYELVSVLNEFASGFKGSSQEADFESLGIKAQNKFEQLQDSYMINLGNIQDGVDVVETHLAGNVQFAGPVLLLPQRCSAQMADRADKSASELGNILVVDTGLVGLKGDKGEQTDYNVFTVEVAGVTVGYAPCRDYLGRKKGVASDLADKLLGLGKLEGSVRLCTKLFDTSLPKVVAELTLGSTTVTISDRNIGDVATIAGSALASLPKPSAEEAPSTAHAVTTAPKSVSEINKKMLSRQLSAAKQARKEEKQAEIQARKEESALKTPDERLALLKSASKKAAILRAASQAFVVKPRAKCDEDVIRALREWVLLDVSFSIQGLDINVQAGTESLVALSFANLSLHLVQRPLDRVADVGLAKLRIIDCQRRPENDFEQGNPVMVTNLSTAVTQAQPGSQLNKSNRDGANFEFIDLKLHKIHAALRFGLVNDLQLFGECVAQKMKTVQDGSKPANVAAKTSVPLDVAEIEPEQKFPTTCRTVKLQVDKLGAYCLPETTARSTVAALRIHGAGVDLHMPSDGSLSVRATVVGIFVDHHLPHVPLSRNGNTSLELAAGSNGTVPILVMAPDCILLEFVKPAPNSNDTASVTLTLRNFSVMAWSLFAKDVGAWALYNPLMDAMNAKKRMESSDTCTEMTLAEEVPPTKEVSAPTEEVSAEKSSMSYDISLHNFALLLPHQKLAQGIRLHVSVLSLNGIDAVSQSIGMQDFALWSYFGDRLLTEQEDNHHLVLIHPIDLNMDICFQATENRRSISIDVLHPLLFRFSYRDIQILAQWAFAMKEMADTLKPQADVADGAEIQDQGSEEGDEGDEKVDEETEENDMSITVAESSSVSDEDKTANPSQVLDVSVLKPIVVDFDVFDDAAGRGQCRQILELSLAVDPKMVHLTEQPHIEIDAVLRMRHYDTRGVATPLMERTNLTLSVDAANKSTKLNVWRPLSFVVTEPLLVDLKRIGAVWGPHLKQQQTSAQHAIDFEAITIENDTGVDIRFGKEGNATVHLKSGYGKEISGRTGSPLHVVEATQRWSGGGLCTIPRNELGHVDRLGFELDIGGPVAIKFDASTKSSSLRHDHDTFVLVNVNKVAGRTTMRLSGLCTVHNLLPDHIQVTTKGESADSFIVNIGDIHGLPLAAGPKASTVIEIQRGGDKRDLHLDAVVRAKRDMKPYWLYINDSWISVAASSKRMRSTVCPIDQQDLKQKTVDQIETPPEGCTLIVKGIGSGLENELSLKALFSRYGHVSKVDMHRHSDKHSGLANILVSWALVTMATKTEAQAALSARIPVNFAASEPKNHQQGKGHADMLRISLYSDMQQRIASNEQLQTHIGAAAITFVCQPAIQLVNLSPVDIDIGFERSGVTSVCSLHANGGHEELCLPGFGDLDFTAFDFGATDISVTVTSEMHGVEYKTATPFVVHGPTLDEDARLELLAGDGQLPIRLHCVHDVTAAGSRIIRLHAPFLLVNTSGCPVQLCPHGQESQTQAVPTTRGKLKDPLPEVDVKSWIHKIHMDDGTILPDSKLLRLACHHGIGHWSRKFTVDSLGAGGILEIKGKEGRSSKQLGILISRDFLGSAETTRWCRSQGCHLQVPPTKVVRVLPRFVFENHLGCNLELAQSMLGDATPDEAKGSSPHTSPGQPMGSCAPGDVTVVNFPAYDAGQPKLLKIRREDGDWSGPFDTDVQEFPVWLRGGADGDVMVYVKILLIDCCVFISARRANDKWPKFRLRNDLHGGSSQQITVKQRHSSYKCTVDAGQQRALAWDLPCGKRKFELTIPGHSGATHVVEIRPEQVGPHKSDNADIPGITITVEGPTRTICVGVDAQLDDESGLIEEGQPELPSTVLLQVAGVELSVVSVGSQDYSPTELLSIGVGQIKLDVEQTAARKTFELAVASLQIDSMLVDHAITFPVILNFITRDADSKEEDARPAIHLCAVIKEQPVKWAMHLDAVSLLVQAIEIRAELPIVDNLLRFLSAVNQESLMELPDDPTPTKTKVDTLVLQAADDGSSNTARESILFVRLLNLGPMSFTITGKMGSNTKGLAGGFAWLAQLNEAPVQLKGIVLENLCGTQSEAMTPVVGHFVQQGKTQVFNIIGSVGILGNPVGLANKLGSGVTTFFYEPIKGIPQGPGQILGGLGKGTASLLDGIVSGGFHAPTEIASALAQQASLVSGTNSHAGQGKKASTVQQGMKYAALDLGTDLHRVTTSVFTETAKGAQSGGALGAVKGLGKGLVGTVGAAAALGLDLATNATAGLGALGKVGQKTAKEAQRLRLPRAIHHGAVIEEFDPERAHGQALLQRVRYDATQAKWGDDLQKATNLVDGAWSWFDMDMEADAAEIGPREFYNDHYEVGEAQWLLLSDEHILLVTGSDGYFSSKIRLTVSWSEQIDHIVALEATNHVLTMHLSHASADADKMHTVEMHTAADVAHVKQLLQEACAVSPSEPWVLPIVDSHLQPEGGDVYTGGQHQHHRHHDGHEEQQEDILEVEPEPEEVVAMTPRQKPSLKRAPSKRVMVEKKTGCGCCSAPSKEEEAQKARRQRNAA